jgi:hypothetical protein
MRHLNNILPKSNIDHDETESLTGSLSAHLRSVDRSIQGPLRTKTNINYAEIEVQAKRLWNICLEWKSERAGGQEHLSLRKLFLGGRALAFLMLSLQWTEKSRLSTTMHLMKVALRCVWLCIRRFLFFSFFFFFLFFLSSTYLFNSRRCFR